MPSYSERIALRKQVVLLHEVSSAEQVLQAVVPSEVPEQVQAEEEEPSEEEPQQEEQREDNNSS